MTANLLSLAAIFAVLAWLGVILHPIGKKYLDDGLGMYDWLFTRLIFVLVGAALVLWFRLAF